MNMDAIYESLVRQIAGDKLQTDSGESLKESVERDEKKKQLEKQIAVLENKMKKEKQLNRRMEMNAELKQMSILLQSLNVSEEVLRQERAKSIAAVKRTNGQLRLEQKLRELESEAWQG